MTKLTFLGTGTSQGVPMIACHCEVCSSSDSRDKRLRSSVLIEHNGRVIVIDAGPDFRQQMLREKVESLDEVFLTHEHKDHTGGLDDLRSYNFVLSRDIDIYALERVNKVVMKDFDYAFSEHRYPGVPSFKLHNLDGEPFEIDGTEIIPIKGKHFMLDILGFRIGNLAYITDFNHIEQEEIDKLKGIDILVINALRPQDHMSHFTLAQAIEVSRKVAPRQTYLTHISHMMGLHEQRSKELPENVFLAYDGLKIETKEQK